jgi:rubrerythrin
MPNTYKCPRFGTPLTLKGGKTGEAKAKAKLLLTMHAERTYVCPKCGYQHQSHTIIMK